MGVVFARSMSRRMVDHIDQFRLAPTTGPSAKAKLKRLFFDIMRTGIESFRRRRHLVKKADLASSRPLTPYQRMLASDAVDETSKRRLREQICRARSGGAAKGDPRRVATVARPVYQRAPRGRIPATTGVLQCIRDRLAYRFPLVSACATASLRERAKGAVNLGQGRHFPANRGGGGLRYRDS